MSPEPGPYTTTWSPPAGLSLITVGAGSDL